MTMTSSTKGNEINDTTKSISRLKNLPYMIYNFINYTMFFVIYSRLLAWNIFQKHVFGHSHDIVFSDSRHSAMFL